MKTWLKGGIYGGAIWILFLSLIYLFNVFLRFLFSYKASVSFSSLLEPLFKVLTYIPWKIMLFTLGPGIQMNPLILLLGYLIFYFIIGAIIGLIIQKVKK